MKIGIITLSASDNCGSLLQAYALQRVLEMRYACSVDILDLKTAQSDAVYELFPKGFYRHPKKTLFTLRYLSSIRKQKQGYQEFRDDHLHMTPRCFRDHHELASIQGEYDILITGSDQVWNVYMSDYSDAFYLPWKDTARKVAYAASLGSTRVIDKTKEAQLREWLRAFDLISVREQTGKETIEKLTDKPVEVLADPTLLLDTAEWNALAGERKVERPYIFYYSWSYPDEGMNRLVQRFAQEQGMDVYVINSSRWYHYRPEKFSFTLYGESGPKVFLNLMKHADYVFVQSFHGAVFANIFRKRYFFLNEHEDGNVDFRTKNIIGLLHQESQIIHTYEDLQCALYGDILYTSVELDDLVARSYQYLDKAIGE